MRRFVPLSAVMSSALVVGVLSASVSVAGAQEAAGPVAVVSTVDAPATDTTPRAAGVIVTTRSAAPTIEAAAGRGLAGDAEVADVTRTSATQQVVTFSEDVPVAVAEQVADHLDARSDVTAAEPDYVRTAADAPPVSVNDPGFPQQVHLWDTSRPGGGFSTRAPAFWATTFGSPAVRVAVLDTGRTAHPDLSWAAGRDVVDNDDNPDDPGTALVGSNGFHGTHVAGIVAARANNAMGVAGVAPGVTIVPVRVLDGAGSAPDSRIAEGILWAAGYTVRGSTNPTPVQVINMSLAGSGRCSTTLGNAITAARSRGVVVVAAAGNDNRDASTYAPASCAGVIAVGATDQAGMKASFSNFGSSVDISAPGVNVLSTLRTSSGYGYGYMSGTSMASPAIAGAAALLASTGLSGLQIEAALPRMVTPSTTSGFPGIVDLRQGVPAPLPPKATSRVSAKVSSSKVGRGKRVTIRVRLRSSTSARPSGQIRVYDGSKIVRRVTVSARRDGNVTVKTPRLHRSGIHRLKVVYLGSSRFTKDTSATRKVRVR